MYIQRKRHSKGKRNRCAKKNARLKAKNRRRKLRKSGLAH
jgi:hypothetical protein